MGNRTLTFHATSQGRRPAEEALETIGSFDEDLRLAMEAALLELISEESFAETRTVYIKGDLHYLQVYHKKRWAFLFFLHLPSHNTIVCLNGYVKKAAKLPAISKAQVRKAHYLTQEVSYA